MSEPDVPPAVPGLPAGFSVRVPDERDVPGIVGLLAAGRRPGDKPVDVAGVSAEVVGPGSWTRRQIVVLSEDPVRGEQLVAHAVVHDRAAGRTNVSLRVAPSGAFAEAGGDAGVGGDAWAGGEVWAGGEARAGGVVAGRADAVAAALLDWIAAAGAAVAGLRGADRTQLDATTSEHDSRLQDWLGAAGYRRVRRWLQQVRPVTAGEATSLPGPRAGVRVRRVREHASGLPVAADVQTVHQVLEESFADHFNSYRESFGEFVTRLREDPWHRWDHWWIAEVELDGGHVPGGVLVGSVSPPDDRGRHGSYVDYLGVRRLARGRGVAKALLHTVIADAARRDRGWVGLEVDADSPTGADGLYRSLGWRTVETTESWHREISATPAPA